MLKEAIAPKQSKFDHRIHQLQSLAGLSQKQLEVLSGITYCAANHQEKIDIQPSALMLKSISTLPKGLVGSFCHYFTEVESEVIQLISSSYFLETELRAR